jgi:hypothetical protein
MLAYIAGTVDQETIVVVSKFRLLRRFNHNRRYVGIGSASPFSAPSDDRKTAQRYRWRRGCGKVHAAFSACPLIAHWMSKLSAGFLNTESCLASVTSNCQASAEAPRNMTLVLIFFRFLINESLASTRVQSSSVVGGKQIMFSTVLDSQAVVQESLGHPHTDSILSFLLLDHQHGIARAFFCARAAPPSRAARTSSRTGSGSSVPTISRMARKECTEVEMYSREWTTTLAKLLFGKYRASYFILSVMLMATCARS